MLCAGPKTLESASGPFLTLMRTSTHKHKERRMVMSARLRCSRGCNRDKPYGIFGTDRRFGPFV
jgi:hypothetical protein